MPATKNEWFDVANKYEELWKFPNCVAAINGEPVNRKFPVKSSSHYFNYKESFSFVLLALVDADHKFRYMCWMLDVMVELRMVLLYEILRSQKLCQKTFKLPAASSDGWWTNYSSIHCSCWRCFSFKASYNETLSESQLCYWTAYI